MLSASACRQQSDGVSAQEMACPPNHEGMRGALLATRFENFEEFKALVSVSYTGNTNLPDSAWGHEVVLCHCSEGIRIRSELVSGPSQQDLTEAKDGNAWKKMALLKDAPEVLAHRGDMERVFLLSRHLQSKFGEGDPAFFDLADSTCKHIRPEDLRAHNPRDTTEKGFINTFNHIIAQAFITSIFSEELADLIADLHERKNMPELSSGRFRPEQLTDPENNPVDNYVDMINNEWGQEIGKVLRSKYGINRGTQWTSSLLAEYLNDIQSFLSWAFGVPMRPFHEDEEVLWRFAAKINMVMNRRTG